MTKDNQLSSIADIIKKRQEKKPPPVYEWQDLALRVIKELGVPNFKRNSVFKICKEHNRDHIIICLNDTKELCLRGEKWKYFFKIIGNK